jgi:hypothetical protein
MYKQYIEKGIKKADGQTSIRLDGKAVKPAAI